MNSTNPLTNPLTPGQREELNQEAFDQREVSVPPHEHDDDDIREDGDGTPPPP